MCRIVIITTEGDSEDSGSSPGDESKTFINLVILTIIKNILLWFGSLRLD